MISYHVSKKNYPSKLFIYIMTPGFQDKSETLLQYILAEKQTIEIAKTLKATMDF